VRRLLRRCSFALALAAGACASTDGLLGGRPDGGGGAPSDASTAFADARSDASPIGDAAAPDGTFVADADAAVDARSTTPPPGCSNSVSGLLGYWKMDEGSGTSVGDCTGNGLNGTLTNGTWTTGRFDGAIQLAGGGFVLLQNPNKLKLTGAITVAAWINIADFNGNGRILSKGGGGTDRGWELNVEGSGIGRFAIATSDVAQLDVATPVLPKNQWLHLAGTYAPNDALKIYLDGSMVGGPVGAPGSMRDSTADPAIGDRDDRCCGWKGGLDEVRVYTRALTAAEIAALAR
jgi:hypothetical protein